MNGWIRRILELLKQDVFGITRSDFFGLGNGAFHAFSTFCKDDFGAISH